MRIERIIIKNYRQYKNLDISFSKSNNDLHILIGKNGMGKTTFLNAINWCLYDEEPHTAESSQKLPLLNLSSINESNIRDKQEVSVELWVTTNEGINVIFKRSQIFKIHGEEKIPIPQNNEFKVYYTDEFGNTNIIEGDEAYIFAEGFIPSAIKEFYFFDGEALDNYFKEEKGQSIKHQIFILSHIHILSSMEKRIEQINKELKKEAGLINPEIEKKRKELEREKGNLKSTITKIEQLKEQIGIANESIKGYEDKLKDMPDASKLEKERQRLKNKRKDLISLFNEKEMERNKFLLEYSKLILLYPVIEKSLKVIDEKKRNKEIPPTIDKGLLERIIEKESCDVCGRHLDEDSKIRVEKLLDTVKLSSEVVSLLHSMENPLTNAENKLQQFNNRRTEIQKQIKIYKNELKDLNNDITQIDQTLSGYNIETITTWHNHRLKLEEMNKNNMIALGSSEEQKKYFKSHIETLKEDYDKALQKENKAKEVRKEMLFCEKALSAMAKTKKDIMNETKEKIELKTKEIFFNLLWKKETFKDVKIDENYKITLIHAMDYNCLGSISAAERELLALSFTLALHKISGFDAPIIVDTPVARVSDDHRKNFADIFLEVSQDKQIILLFTPAEYSEEIQDVLEEKINTKYELKLLQDESEVKIEVLI